VNIIGNTEVNNTINALDGMDIEKEDFVNVSTPGFKQNKILGNMITSKISVFFTIYN
jgi:hypothetical protein